VHRTEGVSVRLEPAARDAAVARLLGAPPAGWAVERPAPDVLVLRRPQERLVIRPSGTEPKLKAYLEVVVAVPEPRALGVAQDLARDRMAALRDEVGALLQA
jgi:phosphomannomutase